MVTWIPSIYPQCYYIYIYTIHGSYGLKSYEFITKTWQKWDLHGWTLQSLPTETAKWKPAGPAIVRWFLPFFKWWFNHSCAILYQSVLWIPWNSMDPKNECVINLIKHRSLRMTVNILCMFGLQSSVVIRVWLCTPGMVSRIFSWQMIPAHPTCCFVVRLIWRWVKTLVPSEPQNSW